MPTIQGMVTHLKSQFIIILPHSYLYCFSHVHEATGLTQGSAWQDAFKYVDANR